MSTWSCQDFDATVTQDFNISDLTYLTKFSFKVIKIGTINSSAIFKVRILDGSREMLSQTFSAGDINTITGAGVRTDVNVDCANLLLTQSGDGSVHTYTLEFSATSYTSSTSSQLLLVRRAFGDNVLTITGLPSDFPDGELANAYPIFIEFFSFKG